MILCRNCMVCTTILYVWCPLIKYYHIDILLFIHTWKLQKYHLGLYLVIILWSQCRVHFVVTISELILHQFQTSPWLSVFSHLWFGFFCRQIVLFLPLVVASAVSFLTSLPINVTPSWSTRRSYVEWMATQEGPLSILRSLSLLYLLYYRCTLLDI